MTMMPSLFLPFYHKFLKIGKYQIKYLVQQLTNGRNIVNAIKLIELDHFPCIAHTLQLSIKKTLEVLQVHKILSRCKKLVEHFMKSTKETYNLREKQKMLQLPNHQPIQHCPTRWGSTLNMLERLAEQQAAICAVLMEGKSRHLIP